MCPDSLDEVIIDILIPAGYAHYIQLLTRHSLWLAACTGSEMMAAITEAQVRAAQVRKLLQLSCQSQPCRLTRMASTLQHEECSPCSGHHQTGPHAASARTRCPVASLCPMPCHLHACAHALQAVCGPCNHQQAHKQVTRSGLVITCAATHQDCPASCWLPAPTKRPDLGNLTQCQSPCSSTSTHKQNTCSCCARSQHHPPVHDEPRLKQRLPHRLLNHLLHMRDRAHSG